MAPIADYHVHVGWYLDGYHSPYHVWTTERDAGITDIYVSSTSTCAELYKLVVREMKELKRLGGTHVHPLLWVTPRMFKGQCRWALPYMLHSGIRWEGIKMHWEAHPEWKWQPHLVEQVISLADKMQVGVLIHTGEKEISLAKNFDPIIKSHPETMFTLAHARPTEQAIRLLKEYSNTDADTAFMSALQMEEMAKEGLASRIKFGTDFPINEYFWPDLNSTEYIRQCREDFQSIIINSLSK